MKRIEDAPKELQDMFADVWEECVCSAGGISDYRDEIEHAFLKGFDVAMATNGSPQRPKRTIAEYHRMDDSFFVISNDRKMFHWQGNKMGWHALPDLPQN